MTDIATLSLEIESQSAKDAAVALDELTVASERSALATARMEQANANARAATMKAAEANTFWKKTLRDTSDEATKVLNRYDPLGAKLRQLEKDFVALNKAAQSGSIAPKDDAAVDRTYARLNTEIVKTKNLMKVAGVETRATFGQVVTGALRATTATSLARHQLFMLGREAVTGDFSRMPRTFGTLISRINLTTDSLIRLLIPLGLIAAAIGTIAILAKAFNDAQKETNAFNNALTVTNNFAGVTSSQVAQMARDIDELGGATIRTAKGIVLSLVGSGRIAAAAIQQVSLLTTQYALATGQDVDSIAPELTKLFSDPAAAASELNQQMHFLAPAQIDYIARLQNIGELGKAQIFLAEELNRHLPDVADNLTTLGKAWEWVRDKASEAWDMMTGVFRVDTLQEQLDEALELLFESEKRDLHFPVKPGVFADSPRTQDLRADVIRIQREIREERRLAKEESEEAEDNRLQNQAAAAANANSRWRQALEVQQQIELVEKMQIANADQRIVKEEALLALRKKLDDLVNPNDLLSGTDVKLQKKLEENIAIIHKWAAVSDARIPIAFQAINLLEDAYFKASGQQAIWLKQQREIAKMLREEERDNQRRQKLEQRQLAQITKFTEANQKRIETLRMEADAIGDSALEQEFAAEAQRLMNAHKKASIGLTEQQQALLDKQLESDKIRIARALRDAQATKRILEAQEEELERKQKIWDNFVENIQRTLGDQLFQVMRGNFDNIGDAFLRMLERMLADALAANIIGALFPAGPGNDSIVPLLFGAVAGAGGGGGTGVDFAAKGATFDRDVAEFANGGVVSNPTSFAFSSGGLLRRGLMGEQGAEAIIPLKRDSSGKLGVSTVGSKSNLTYSPTINIDSRTDRADVLRITERAVSRGNKELVEQLSRAGAI